MLAPKVPVEAPTKAKETQMKPCGGPILVATLLASALTAQEPGWSW